MFIKCHCQTIPTESAGDLLAEQVLWQARAISQIATGFALAMTNRWLEERGKEVILMDKK